ncbi:MAG: beta strand repeat-containing protein [Pirellulales bacterium]
MLAAVSWDGGGDGINWSDPLNWSGNALPAVVDDVTIDVPGTITVVHASGTSAIHSLTCAENLNITGGSLRIQSGAGVVDGSLSISSPAELHASGSTATFVANGAVTLNGARLTALAGGQLDLSAATAYTLAPGNPTAIFASGTGSKVDLSGLISLSGTVGGVDITAVSGGTIDLSSLSGTEARDVDFEVDGATSVLDLSALSSVTDLTRLSSLTLENGGTLIAPLLEAYSGGRIAVNNMSVTLSSLLFIDASSLSVGAGGILSLPNVTTYIEPTSASASFTASGANSRLDLSAITSIVGDTGALNVSAVEGGMLELDGIAESTARDVSFSVNGATSVLDLSALVTINDPTRLSSLSATKSGTLVAPVLASVVAGAISVGDGALTLSALTNIDASSLYADINGVLTLPAVTAYVEPASTTAQFSANGVNARIDLPALTSISGTGGGLLVSAANGGTMAMDALQTITAGSVNFDLYGATSLLSMAALTSAIDPTSSSSMVFQAGAVLNAPNWSTYNGGYIRVYGATLSLPQFTNVNGTSLVAGTGATLALPNVTSYVKSSENHVLFRADTAGSLLDLSGLTSITGNPGSLQIDTYGGTIDMSALTSMTTRSVQFWAYGSGGHIDLSSLANIHFLSFFNFIGASTSGSVTLPPGTANFVGTNITVENGGTIDVGTLVLEINSSLTGSNGSINGNVVNKASTSGSNQPGFFTVEGSYSQANNGYFSFPIYGSIQEVDYDTVYVTDTVTLAGNLFLWGPYVPNVGDSFLIIDNLGADPIVGAFNSAPEGAIYMLNGRPLRISYTGGDGNDVVLTAVDNLVANRRLFYNQSVFDGNNASINASDDGAIAPDKTAYLPGAGLAVFENVSSYSRGINGLVIDLAGGGTHTSIDANDFVFKVGANNSPNTWSAAPSPSAISVRTGAGAGGSDRVEITWANNAIENVWLEVQVLATANTGLTATDVFFFGNRIGDTGSPTATSFTTTTSDANTITGGGLGSASGITDVRDIDRSNTITVAGDRSAALGNIGALNRLDVGTAGPFAPDSGDAGIASALAATSGSKSSLPAALPVSVANRLAVSAAAPRAIAVSVIDVAASSGPLLTSDALADSALVDDQLLDELELAL